MHPYDIVFLLNKTQKLIVDLEDPFELMPCYCLTKISFYDGDTEYILDLYAELGDSMRCFTANLGKALRNELQLNQFITKDIGVLHNEFAKYVNKDTDDDQRKLYQNRLDEHGFEHWVGEQYALWECGQWAAWMYNDTTGAIIFKITPFYPGFFTTEEDCVEFPSYEEWMQSYHPAITVVIPREVAHQWLEQASKILAHIAIKQCAQDE